MKCWSGVQRVVLSDMGFTVTAEGFKYLRNNTGRGVHASHSSAPDGLGSRQQWLTLEGVYFQGGEDQSSAYAVISAKCPFWCLFSLYAR